MKKILTLYLLSLLTSLGGNAQINESDTNKVQLQLAVRGSYQSGNVELLRMANQLDVSVKFFQHWVFKSQNDQLYQRIFKQKADSDLGSRNYLYFRPERKVYPYAIGFLSANFRRNIELRTFVGIGLTYQLLQKQNHTFKLSGNLLYESSRYSDFLFNYGEFDGNNQLSAFWSTVYWSGFHNFKGSGLNLVYEFYWQQSLEDQVNYRYHLLSGIDVKLFGGLSLQSRLVYAFENVVSSGVQRDDLLWIWGIAWRYR